jgi:probable HAF family extracellular repeat protein
LEALIQRAQFFDHATEWSGGDIISLGALPGASGSEAFDINAKGQAVGVSFIHDTIYATEWSGGKIINLGGLPGSTLDEANGINDAGQVAGVSVVGGVAHAIEWSGASIIDLGAVPGCHREAKRLPSTTPGKW